MNPRSIALGAPLLALFGAAHAAPCPQDESGTSRDAAPTARTEKESERGDPFLWRITGHGAAGYLFGTIHLPDPEVLAFPKSVESAFEESDTFFAEIDATKANESKIQSMARLPEGESAKELVGQETWDRITARIRRAVTPVQGEQYADLIATGWENFELWAINAMLPMLDYFEEQLGGAVALDKVLYDRAAQEGKRVGGLETVEEQVGAFRTFTRDEQVAMLRDALDLLDEYEAKGRNPMQETVAAWHSGDEKRLLSLLDDGFGKDPVMRERAANALLWKRNHTIAKRIAAEMRDHPDESIFFAVGALHMPDPAEDERADGEASRAARDDQESAKEREVRKLGVVSLLRERGFTLERVGTVAKIPVNAGSDK